MENQKSTSNVAEVLKQICVDWEDDELCSPHRVKSDKVSGAMRPILERLYNLAENLERCAPQKILDN
jgi:hypothetical protein